jgi:hypothetical protein
MPKSSTAFYDDTNSTSECAFNEDVKPRSFLFCSATSCLEWRRTERKSAHADPADNCTSSRKIAVFLLAHLRALMTAIKAEQSGRVIGLKKNSIEGHDSMSEDLCINDVIGSPLYGALIVSRSVN